MAFLRKIKFGRKKRLLIVGAGAGGQMVAQSILSDPKSGYIVMGFIDDSPEKIGTTVLGARVFGPLENIHEVSLELDVDEILIAIPSAEGDFVKRVFMSATGLKVDFSILPSYYENIKSLMKEEADFEDVRALAIEDFFRKKPQSVNIEEQLGRFREKTVLVTGAAGSIGSELCRQLLAYDIKALIAVDNNETELHNLRNSFSHLGPLQTVLCDIRDGQKLHQVMSDSKPDIVFHAAAYKHVPEMERYPDEAIKNNVFATKNLIEAAKANRVQNFIFVSTDKAVNPSSIMGASKRLAELLVQNSESGHTNFVTVRFGNVMGSRGSVIPLFKKQIREGGPLTITHPDMKRFFMAIPEAVYLTIQAFVLGADKDTFILEMGEQLSIKEVASLMVQLEGYRSEDIEIKITGSREGEKLYEELATSHEEVLPTNNPQVHLVRTKKIEQAKLEEVLRKLKDATIQNDSKEIRNALADAIPEFKQESSKEAFLPYCLPQIGEEEIEEVVDTLRSGWMTMGPKTVQFEKDLAEYVGVKHAIAVNSCTAGLHLSLLALGITEGDEVITTPFTFAASGNVIVHAGAKPVFVDIDAQTYNIDPKKLEEKITPRTKAILVVHYGGQSADLDEIQAVADKYGIHVIEDAAHAIGSEYKGKKIGSHGNLTSYSFYATKNLTTGEGGAIVTNDDALAEKLRILRLHGISKDAWKRYDKEGSWYYEIEECGWKYNMTDIAAAIGRVQLQKLPSFTKKRQEIASAYNNSFRQLNLQMPAHVPHRNHVYHLYPILVDKDKRNEYIEDFAKKGIGTSVHFIPLHLHPFYQRTFGYKMGDFPVTERIYQSLISLPLYPKMGEEDIKRVINAVGEVVGTYNGKSANESPHSVSWESRYRS